MKEYFHDKRDWFLQKRFGLFIHWGIYAQGGLHEQEEWRYNVPKEKYEKYVTTFNPEKFEPARWLDLCQECGMEYLVFTAKHHDGFCMWDTRLTPYNIMNTPYGRDTLRMLADACRKYGMKLSLYYSIPDWHEPCAYNPASTHQWKSVAPEKSDTEAYRAYVKRAGHPPVRSGRMGSTISHSWSTVSARSFWWLTSVLSTTSTLCS